MAAHGDHTGALALLGELERAHSGSGLLWQERSACHRARGDTAAAIAAYRRAVELNDTLVMSWRALQEFYRAGGQLAEGDYASACLKTVTALPPAPPAS
jgi:tetratricopeptide (TPR) repeat protein